MIIKIKDSVLVKREKERVVAVLQMKNPDGSLMFPAGLSTHDLAQQLVGVGCGNVASKEFLDRVVFAVGELISENVSIDQVQDLKDIVK